MKTNKLLKAKAQSHGKGWVLMFSVLLVLLFGGSPAQAADVYRVTMTRTGVEGLTTDCSVEGYVLAHRESNYLKASGSDLEADQTLGPALSLNIGNDGSPVAWSRSYDAGRGLEGVFNGCLGGPSGPSNYSGALFIFFEGGKGKTNTTVRFTWHFEYYIAPNVREHFTLMSGKIPFPAWTGGNVSGTVKGDFDFSHYLNDGTRKVKNYYTPIPRGQGRLFEFVLTIERVQ